MVFRSNQHTLSLSTPATLTLIPAPLSSLRSYPCPLLSPPPSPTSSATPSVLSLLPSSHNGSPLQNNSTLPSFSSTALTCFSNLQRKRMEMGPKAITAQVVAKKRAWLSLKVKRWSDQWSRWVVGSMAVNQIIREIRVIVCRTSQHRETAFIWEKFSLREPKGHFDTMVTLVSA